MFRTMIPFRIGRHVRHQIAACGAGALLLLSLTIAHGVVHADAADTPNASSSRTEVPRFGTIRVALDLPGSESLAPAGRPAVDMFRAPPVSQAVSDPVSVSADELQRFPETRYPQVSDRRKVSDVLPDPPPSQTPSATTLPNEPTPARRPRSAGPRIVAVSPPSGTRSSVRIAEAPSLFGDDPDRLFGPPRDTAQEPSGDTPEVATPADSHATNNARDSGDDEGPVDLSVLQRSPFFSPDPCYDPAAFNPERELAVYEGKYCFPTQRPWIELGRGFYAPGPIPPSSLILGETNPVTPRFLLFGDYRMGLGYADNSNNVSDRAVWAHQLNLDFDLKITGTERIHAFWSPLDEDGLATRVEADQNRFEIREAFDDDFDTLFFEGDLGYLMAGFDNRFSTFDLPFVAGKFPMLLQNGVWLFDVLEGFSFAIPARNSAAWDISNYDITFFVGFDDVDSPAFGRNDNAANVYGAHGYFETAGGYLETGYAFLDDTTGAGLSYHNVGISFSRRYWHRVSNAVRIMVNAGQNPNVGADTADGALVLFENAFITSNPNYFVPYVNLFAGMGRPQSVARAAGAGGVLFGTGINFESDNLTGFPTLDATAQNAYGGAMGVNLLGPMFSHQWVFELATVQTFGRVSDRIAAGDQYAAGMRYQMPINNAWLIRFDAMHGFLENAPDVTGGRMELRWKF